MDEKMKERLDATESRYNELQEQMQDSAVFSDIKKYTVIAKEAASLEEIVNTYAEYKKTLQEENEAEILQDDNDPEISAMATEMLEIASKKKEELEEKLTVLLLPSDPNDDKNVIVEIRGAAGGDEANIFAGDLFRMYSYYAEKNGWKLDVLESYPSERGGFALISFSLKGDRVYSKMKYESGVHRVQRVPTTESQGRIQTSTATVIVMPEAEEIDVEIKDADIRIDTFRASGAGGQHINKTDSAVRITHFPTGIVVTCQDGRSQIENKAQAMLVLKTKVYDKIRQEAEKERGDERISKIGTGDRAEKIRTYNYPQSRVTDHRIGLTLQSLPYIMDGDLDPIIDALINEDQKLKLEGSGL